MHLMLTPILVRFGRLVIFPPHEHLVPFMARWAISNVFQGT